MDITIFIISRTSNTQNYLILRHKLDFNLNPNSFTATYSKNKVDEQ